jgi:hypothetical protein
MAVDADLCPDPVRHHPLDLLIMANFELSMSLDGSLGDGDCSTVIDVRAGVGEIVGTAREHRSAEPVNPAVPFVADASPNSQSEPGGGNGERWIRYVVMVSSVRTP